MKISSILISLVVLFVSVAGFVTLSHIPLLYSIKIPLGVFWLLATAIVMVWVFKKGMN